MLKADKVFQMAARAAMTNSVLFIFDSGHTCEVDLLPEMQSPIYTLAEPADDLFTFKDSPPDPAASMRSAVKTTDFRLCRLTKDGTTYNIYREVGDNVG